MSNSTGYTPPPGRPQSTPPSATPLALPPKPQKTPAWYASRNTEAFRRRLSVGLKRGAKIRERTAEAVALRRNASDEEMNGYWMTVAQYAKHAGISVGQASRHFSIHATDWRVEEPVHQYRIALVPYGVSFSDETETADQTKPPEPTAEEILKTEGYDWHAFADLRRITGQTDYTLRSLAMTGTWPLRLHQANDGNPAIRLEVFCHIQSVMKAAHVKQPRPAPTTISVPQVVRSPDARSSAWSRLLFWRKWRLTR